MIVPYYSKCLVLRSASQILRLPAECVSSALILLHRYKQACLQEAETHVDDDRIVAVCLFTAAKLEETECRTTDILSVVRAVIDRPADYHLSKALPSLLSGGSGSRKKTVIAGEVYFKEKERLISMEHALLRSIHYDVVLPHLHRELLILCRDFEVEAMVCAVAIRLLNDMMTFTNMVLHYESNAIVVSVLYASFALLQCRRSVRKLQRSEDGKEWYEQLGFSVEVVDTLGHHLVDMLLETQNLST